MRLVKVGGILCQLLLLVFRCDLSLIRKLKESGDVKFRLLENYRSNGVNSQCTRLKETISLPTLQDIRCAVSQLDSSKSHSVYVSDVKNAYRLLSVHPQERKFLYTEYRVDGSLMKMQRNVLPFGLVSAPYLFCRASAVCFRLMRLLGSLYQALGFVYIDDHLWICPSDSLNELAAINLVLGSFVGLQWATDKLKLGRSVNYIGFNIDMGNRVVSLDKSKLLNWTASIKECIQSSKVDTDIFQELLGRISFVCSIRPSSRVLLKECYSMSGIINRIKLKNLDCVKSKALYQIMLKVLELIQDEVMVLHFKRDITWAMVDACLDGISVCQVLDNAWVKINYRVKDIFFKYSDILKLSMDCSSMIIYEMIAIVVCVIMNPGTHVRVLSDNSSSVIAASKGKGKNLLQSQLGHVVWSEVAAVFHIPGVENHVANGVSRSGIYNGDNRIVYRILDKICNSSWYQGLG